jgi:hypothetical protein
MANGHKSRGFTTDRGRVTIVGARTSNGAICFTPILPGENEHEWQTHLNGLQSRFVPADTLEEEMVFQLAISFWQARRLHRYEKAAVHAQMDAAAEEGKLFGKGDAFSQVLARGVESIEAAIAELSRLLELAELVTLAEDSAPLETTDAFLLLQRVLEMTIKGKTVHEAFTGLPVEGWTWAIVRENLNDLAEVSGKSVAALLLALCRRVRDELEELRATLVEGVRAIETHYLLKYGETERLLLYHSRVQSRIAKWLALLGLARDDRLGVTTTRPLEVTNGINGDGNLE